MNEQEIKQRRVKLPSPRERPLFYLVCLMIFLVCAWRVTGRPFPHQEIVFYNATASLPTGFYLAWPFGEIKRGDLVIYTPTKATRDMALERGYIEKEDTSLLKRVAALGGDHYRISKQNIFFVEGKYIGMVSEKDSKERPLPQLAREHEYIVPPGDFLPVGDASRSFDGRYTGTVPLSAIKTRVVPIPFLTF